jgi:release factor glutamine methyltransferase
VVSDEQPLITPQRPLIRIGYCTGLIMTPVGELLRESAARLAETSTTPRLDAELLLAYVLGWSRARTIAERDYCPTTIELAAFADLTARRSAGEPVAYLLGMRAFYGLELLVDRRVLVPRPETELLVELALDAARRVVATGVVPIIADIGVGSGAITAALATHVPSAQYYATDLSLDALDLARHNLERLGLADRVTLLHGDLLTALPAPVDLLISNPPYTILAEIDPAVHAYEPHLALDGGGSDGADIYRRLIPQIPACLRPGGTVLLEIGAWQAAIVVDLLRTYLPDSCTEVHRDLADRDRVICSRRTA